MRYAFLVLVLFFLIATVAQSAQERRSIVVFNPAVNEPARQALLRAVGAIIIKDLPLIDGKAVLLPPRAEAALSRMAEVVRIDPDVIVVALTQTLPWGVDRIDADLAWGTSTGSGVKVAIVDTGISTNHPDLKVWGGINTIDPKKGYDDDNGHGSHVAGTVAALNNTAGVVGVAYTAKLYAVKVLNASGSGYLSDVIEGLDWCIKNKMQVVNMSLGTSTDVQSFHDAVKKVNEAGMVQVAAAGNTYGGRVTFPAAYPETIAVSATDKTNTIASFSSVGPEIDLAAPGVDILSTFRNKFYATMSGTSMSAPHVSGTAALVIAAGVTGVDNVRERLQSTADDLGDTGLDPYYGYGLVDAEEAVTGSQTRLAPRPGVLPVSGLSLTWGELKSR